MLGEISKLRYKIDDFGYFQQVIFAGTSFNESKARSILVDGLKWEKPFHWLEFTTTYNMAIKFPLVVDRNAAEKALKLYGLDGAAIAVDQSEPLWGRVKWTAMYAEKIIEEIKKGATKDYDVMSKEEYEKTVRELFALKQKELDFNILTDETYKKIVEDLCVRLDVLQKRGDCSELLDKLLEAAISADILGRPHVFYQEGDMMLVEQGFAIVDSWMNQLEFKLKGHFTIVGRMESQLTATLKNDQPVKDGIISLLAEVDKVGCALKNCSMDELTDEMLREGFTIVDCTMFKLATEMEEDGFTIVDKSRDQLRAKPVKGFTKIEKLTTEIVEKGFTIWGDDKRKQLRNLSLKIMKIDKATDYRSFAKLREGVISEPEVKKLEEILLEHGFIMMNKTIDQLTNLVQNDFTIPGSHEKTPRERWKGRLRGQNFHVEAESGSLLRVKHIKGPTIKPEEREDIQPKEREDNQSKK